MSELLAFAAKLIELEGGAVECHPYGLDALLPSNLSSAWGTADGLELSDRHDDAGRFSYGTELLDRMIQTATQAVPIACARLDLAPIRASQVRNAAEQWRLRNGLADVGEVRMGTQTRLWLSALATLNGDEKRELLVSAVMSVRSGTLVDGFADAAVGLAEHKATFPPAPAGPLERALAQCVRQAEAGATAFREGMTRRYERDRLRIEGYFDDLLAELGKRASKGRGDQEAIADKRRAMLADRAAKLEALSARFVLRIEVKPLALLAVEVDGATVTLGLRRRKASRAIELEYDAATRRFVPPMCEACGGSAHRPAACDDAVHLLCEGCAPRAEGRIACPACKRSTRSKDKVASASYARRTHRSNPEALPPLQPPWFHACIRERSRSQLNLHGFANGSLARIAQ